MRKWHGSEEVKKSGRLQNYTQENNLVTITWSCLEIDKSESAKILRDRSGASGERQQWARKFLPEIIV